jgi:hypothetical protein
LHAAPDTAAPITNTTHLVPSGKCTNNWLNNLEVTLSIYIIQYGIKYKKEER